MARSLSAFGKIAGSRIFLRACGLALACLYLGFYLGYRQGAALQGLAATTVRSMASQNNGSSDRSAPLIPIQRQLNGSHNGVFSPATPHPPIKVAIYMTTHLSQEHVDFLLHCWPLAIQRLPLLREADLILYTGTSTNSKDTVSWIHKIGFRTVTVRNHSQPPPPPLPSNATGEVRNRRKQQGAVQAIVDPFLPQNHNHASNQSSWFDGYDWIIRLNPDVLIRRDDWLLETIANSSVDAILVDYSFTNPKTNRTHGMLHTDFMAFRPHKVNPAAWIKAQNTAMGNHAESHIYRGFSDLIDQQRVAWLPNTSRYLNWARVLGVNSDVVHWHPMLQECPNYFTSSDGKVY